MFMLKDKDKLNNLTTRLTSFYVDYRDNLYISFINSYYLTILNYTRLRVLPLLITLLAMA
jgi:hypothetical protein